MTSFAGARAQLRPVLVQAHWLVGISAGTLLMVIGLSGAILSFEDELLDAFNPGVRRVAPRAGPALTPAALLAALPALPPQQSIQTLIVSAEPGRSIQVQTKTGEQRSPPLYADPYTGEWLGSAAGQDFFDWVERLHRFLLLPRAPGRVAAGVLASCLLLLVFSGLYLRWPRQPHKPASWLLFNRKLRGRPFWWALHAVLATWALPAWLILAGSGIYWSFDAVRSTVEGWAGVRPSSVPARTPAFKTSAPQAQPHPDLSLAWRRFEQTVPAWHWLRLRLPGRAGEPLELLWTAPDAAHERQRSRMSIALDGRLEKDQRFADQSTGKRALATIYPLHMGSYFGLPGRLAMALSSLALPLIGFTGWLLYLQRRRQKRATQAQRRALAPDRQDSTDTPILVAWASQGGRAEALALRSAAALRSAGRRVALKSLASLAPAELAGFGQALFVVSTFGDGQAPDNARAFLPALERAEAPLPDLHFAVLALGNRQYTRFCAFGHSVQTALLAGGARALAPLTTVCESEPAALAPWFAGLTRFAGDAAAPADNAEPPTEPPHEPDWQRWTLVQRQLMNPGSAGEPLFELTLRPVVGADLPAWAPGALVEIRPPEQAMNDLPSLPGALKALAGRRYSIASTADDGVVQLIVRQHRHAGVLGVCSGFLTADCAPGDEISLRLQANPSFFAPVDPRPCLFIGNGSGLAGLRGLIRDRVRRGLARNWLVFGERSRADDTLCAEEFAAWSQAGLVEVDRVFSREPGGGYVQDHLRARRERLQRWLDDGAVVHVCGSLNGMAAGVEGVLHEVLGRDGLDRLAAQGRYRRDVY